jgi:hypothetical protein
MNFGIINLQLSCFYFRILEDEIALISVFEFFTHLLFLFILLSLIGEIKISASLWPTILNNY